MHIWISYLFSLSPQFDHLFMTQTIYFLLLKIYISYHKAGSMYEFPELVYTRVKLWIIRGFFLFEIIQIGNVYEVQKTQDSTFRIKLH